MAAIGVGCQKRDPAKSGTSPTAARWRSSQPAGLVDAQRTEFNQAPRADMQEFQPGRLRALRADKLCRYITRSRKKVPLNELSFRTSFDARQDAKALHPYSQ
jgi:hypothetical protein